MFTIKSNDLGKCWDAQAAGAFRRCTGGNTAPLSLLRVLWIIGLVVLLVAAPMAQSAEAAAIVLPPIVDPDDRAAPPAATVVPPIAAPDDRVAPPADDGGRVRQQATRGGAGYRSPGGTFSGGGPGTGAAPGAGYRTGPRAPSPGVTTPPRTTAPGAGGGLFGRAGSFFGGMAAGALLGHLFNPFAGLGWGWGAGTGLGAGLGIVMSLVSLLVWAGLLYGAYRLIRRMMGGGRGRGGGGWAR